MANPDAGLTREAKKDAVMATAFYEAGKYGLATGVLAGGAVLAANKYSAWFGRSFNTSGKAALVFMSALGVWGTVAEITMVSAQRDPEAWGIGTGATVQRHTTQKPAANKLGPQHKLANLIYDYPFRTVVLTAAPILGGIAYHESMAHPDLKFSQKVMHTRVYGQGSVLAILVGTMAFHDWMRKRGRFEVEPQTS